MGHPLGVGQRASERRGAWAASHTRDGAQRGCVSGSTLGRVDRPVKEKTLGETSPVSIFQFGLSRPVSVVGWHGGHRAIGRLQFPLWPLRC
jgi:hypothetical protein